MPGAPQGLQAEDPTIAELLKPHGYMTGQFGKNHLGDRDEHLPTNHGFDEFFGNLYHLNLEEEPELPDYPTGEMRKKIAPRGVIHSYADGRVEDTGPLTKKRMETVDEEVLAATKDFIQRADKADKPFFVWFNATRMHVFTHLKPESEGVTGHGIYPDGMVEHDHHVGELLNLLDELGIEKKYDCGVLHRQRCRGVYLARRRHNSLPRREGHNLGGRIPGTRRRSLAGQDPGGQGGQRHRLPRGLAAHALGHRRRAPHQGEAA
jgi:hypothetical protein